MTSVMPVPVPMPVVVPVDLPTPVPAPSPDVIPLPVISGPAGPKGDKGDTGDTGVVAGIDPVVYTPVAKTVSLTNEWTDPPDAVLLFENAIV